jgi:hypothetical protein
MLLAKAALCAGGSLVLAGAYTFHQGILRIDVDEYRSGGSHVHVWLPAAVVPMAMHLVPDKQMRCAFNDRNARIALPLVRDIAKELNKYPNTDFVEIVDHDQHVHIRTHNGKLQIDVEAPNETVHVLCPLATIEDVTTQLEERAPAA